MTANRELFIKAFIEADSAEIEKYLKKDDFHYEFSEAFERKMNRLISKDNRIRISTRRKISKALIAALIAIIVLLTGLMSVSASREKIVEFIERVFSTNTQITLSENSAPTPETIETAYTLGYVPEGFELKQYDADDFSVLAIWENKIGEEIVFTQDILNIDLSIDNEHSYRTIEINGYKAYLLYDKFETIMCFSDGEYWFKIIVPKELKDEIILISEKIIKEN